MSLKSPGNAEIVEGRINISPIRGPEMRPNRPKNTKKAENNPQNAQNEPEISGKCGNCGRTD